jgi:hypothetical protein
MASLTKDSPTAAIVELAGDPALYNALDLKENQEKLAALSMHKVGDLLTPAGEAAVLSLRKMGPALMMRLHAALLDNGFYPNWPNIEERRFKSGSLLSPSFNLAGAIEAADSQHALKTGGPPGEFSRKIMENTKAQEDGARLKGRRTL